VGNHEMNDSSDFAQGGTAASNFTVFGSLAALSLCMLLPSLSTSIANVALPTLATALQASFQSVQWIVLAYLLAITTMIVTAGRLGDMVDRRKVLLGGLVLFIFASLVCGAAPSLWVLLAARVAQGLGAATMMALTMAFVAETMPKERIGSAMGLLGSMSAIGTALGPSAGGVLIDLFSWRAIFLINLPLGLVSLWLVWRYLPARRAIGDKRVEFDNRGTVVLGLALAAYALAMTAGGGSFGLQNALLLATSIALGILFIAVEGRVASPLVQLEIFRNTSFSSSLGINVLVGTVMMTTLVVGPFYLSRALGLTAAQVGFVMSIGPAISIMTGVPSGRIVDRFGASRIVVAGLIMLATGSALLATLPTIFGVAGYVAAIFVLTPGYQMFQAANNTTVMEAAPTSRRGVYSAVLNLSRNLGLITGASLMGAVFAAGSAGAIATTNAAGNVTQGMQIAFSVVTGLMVTALVLIFVLRRPARIEVPQDDPSRRAG
jgi:EmrB/QacA subfamily drug resistance transporter